jgi:hypothetical protein
VFDTAASLKVGQSLRGAFKEYSPNDLMRLYTPALPIPVGHSNLSQFCLYDSFSVGTWVEILVECKGIRQPDVGILLPYIATDNEYSCPDFLREKMRKSSVTITKVEIHNNSR